MTEETPPKQPEKQSRKLAKYLAAGTLGLAGVAGAFVAYDHWDKERPREISVSMTAGENKAFKAGDLCMDASIRHSFGQAAVAYMEAEGKKDISLPLVIDAKDPACKGKTAQAGPKTEKIGIEIPKETYLEFRDAFREGFQSKEELVDMIAMFFLYYALSEEIDKTVDAAKKPVKAPAPKKPGA